MNDDESQAATEETQPSLDLVRQIILKLDVIEKRLDGDLKRIEAKVDENGRKTDEQLSYLKTQIERLGHDDKLHQHEVQRLKERVAMLEVRLARDEDARHRSTRESNEGLEMQKAAFESAMLIASKRDEEIKAIATEAKETNALVIEFLAAAAKSPEMKKARRLLVPAVCVGFVLAGFVLGLISRAPSLALKTDQSAQVRQENPR